MSGQDVAFLLAWRSIRNENTPTSPGSPAADPSLGDGGRPPQHLGVVLGLSSMSCPLVPAPTRGVRPRRAHCPASQTWGRSSPSSLSGLRPAAVRAPLRFKALSLCHFPAFPVPSGLSWVVRSAERGRVFWGFPRGSFRVVLSSHCSRVSCSLRSCGSPTLCRRFSIDGISRWQLL